MSKDAAQLPDDVALCHQIIRDLQREVAELKARLNQNSSNSSKSPSSDPPSVKRAPPKRPTGKKRGGQRGHKPHRRDLVPPEKVTASFDIKPETCRIPLAGGAVSGRFPSISGILGGITLLAILAAVAKLIFALFELDSGDAPGLEWLHLGENSSFEDG